MRTDLVGDLGLAGSPVWFDAGWHIMVSLPLLTVDALVDSGSPPHSLQLPKYHLTVFWQRGEQRGMWKRRNDCLQAVRWESSPLAWSCSRIYLYYYYFSRALLHKNLCSSKMSRSIKEVKVLEIWTLGELISSWKCWGFWAAGALSLEQNLGFSTLKRQKDQFNLIFSS